jgi:sterol 3beta-glucosyltransferase
VTLATHRSFEPDARRLGLGFAPIEGNPREILETEEGRAWLEAGRHPLRGARRLLALARPLAARLLADATAACQDAEAIIYAPLGFAGAHIAERNRVPAVLASLVPLSPPGVSGARRACLAVGWRLQPAQSSGR